MSQHEPRLPFHIDTGALSISEYAVSDLDYKLVGVFDTLEEAEAFVAEANGTDVEKVRRDTEELGHMLAEYRNNLIRHSRAKRQS